VHNDPISGGRTEQLDIITGFLTRQWLYKWFSQFHSCATYSVLSQSHWQKMLLQGLVTTAMFCVNMSLSTQLILQPYWKPKTSLSLNMWLEHCSCLHSQSVNVIYKISVSQNWNTDDDDDKSNSVWVGLLHTDAVTQTSTTVVTSHGQTQIVTRFESTPESAYDSAWLLAVRFESFRDSIRKTRFAHQTSNRQTTGVECLTAELILKHTCAGEYYWRPLSHAEITSHTAGNDCNWKSPRSISLTMLQMLISSIYLTRRLGWGPKVEY